MNENNDAVRAAKVPDDVRRLGPLWVKQLIHDVQARRNRASENLLLINPDGAYAAQHQMLIEVADRMLAAAQPVAPTEPVQQPGDVRDAEQIQRWASWIAINRPEHFKDHACARCVPHSDMLVTGFSCVYHDALDVIGGKSGAAIAAARPSAPEGWISVDERLPETSITDDSECYLGDKKIAPAIGSERVMVALSDGRVRVDALGGLDDSPPYWDRFNGKVTHWMPLPPAPDRSAT